MESSVAKRRASTKVGNYFQKYLNRRGALLFIYTLVFAVTFACCMYPLFVNGRTMIWTYDGLDQAYVWFIAIRDWFRTLFSNVFINGTFEIPQWNPAWGYGADEYVSLASFLPDPFFWISVLTPWSTLEFSFQLAIVLRLYFAGLAFVYYARWHQISRASSLLGAMIYIFCGPGMICVHQGFLVNGLLAFPLILLGVDKVMMRNQRPTLLLVSLGWLYCVSFNIAFSVTLLLIPYCIMRYTKMVGGTWRAKTFLPCVAKMVGLVLLAIGLSMIVVAPTLGLLLGMDRLGLDRGTDLFYEPIHYAALFRGFSSHYQLQDDAVFGFGPTALLCVVLLILRRKKHPWLVFFTLGLLLLQCLPFAGSLLNGFQYPGNRWVFVTAFCLAYGFVVLLPELKTLKRREKMILLVVLLIYATLVFLFLFSYLQSWYVSGTGLFFSSLVVAYVFILDKKDGARQTSLVFLSLVMVGAVVNYWGLLSPQIENKAAQQIEQGAATNLLANDLGIDAVEIDNDDFYRVEAPGALRNAGLAHKVPSVSFYNSLYNNYVDKFHTSLGLTTSDFTYAFNSLDRRSGLESLLGCRYYVLPWWATENWAPYSYAQEEEAAGSIMKSDRALPLAVGWQEEVQYDTYEAAGLIGRQELLLQGIVLDEDVLPDVQPIYSQEILDYAITLHRADGTEETVHDNQFTIESPADWIEIKFHGLPECETYLVLNDLQYEYISPMEMLGESNESLTAYESNLAWVNSLNNSESNKTFSIGVEGAVASDSIRVFDAGSNLYSNKRDWAFNLGYAVEPQSSFKMTFSQAATPSEYSYGSLEVIALPMEVQDSRLELIKKQSATNISYSWNHFEATYDAPKESVLLVTVPYSVGWQATVDGEPVDILMADVGFMGIPMSEGTHHVALRYQTPLFDIGAIISLISLGIVVMLSLLWPALGPRIKVCQKFK